MLLTRSDTYAIRYADPDGSGFDMKGPKPDCEVDPRGSPARATEPGIRPGRTYPVAVSAVSTNRWDELNPPEAGQWSPRLRVSVVIPYYDSLAALRRTLIGLAAQTYPADLTEIIVVDDGSPRPLDQASLEGLPPAEIVTRPNVGFTLAAARNEGAVAARGDILAFLDHDMLPDPGWLEHHLRWHHTQPRPVLVLGSRSHVDDAWLTEDIVSDAVRSGGLAGALEGREVQVPEWIEFHLQRTARLTSADDDIFRVVTGGNLSISREFFDDIGGFDPSFVRWGGEDTELGYRAWVSGALLIPEQGAHCWHQGLGVVPDDAERLSQRIQQRKLAHLIPIPGFRTSSLGRTWSRPRVVAEVVGDDPDDVVATVGSLLKIPDLVVVIESDHPLILEDLAPDLRVDVGAQVDIGRYRFSPFHARVPAGLGLSESLFDSLVDEARDSGLATTRDGVRFESRRHVNTLSETVSASEHVAGRAPRSSSTKSRVLNRIKRIRSMSDATRAARWFAGSVKRRLTGPGKSGTTHRSRGSSSIHRLESDPWSRVIAVGVPALPATGSPADERIDLVITATDVADPSGNNSRHLVLDQTHDPALLSYPPLDPATALAVIRDDNTASDPLSALLRGSLPETTPPGRRTAKAAHMATNGLGDDPSGLESMRRAVLSEHLPTMRLDQLRSAAKLAPLAPLVSVILASRRSDSLSDVVAAISRQTYPEMELILVTHGMNLPEGIEETLLASGIHHEIVPAAGDMTFGSVLSIASRRAAGDLLAKMDDDDLYSCTHVEDLVNAYLLSGADLVGKGAEFVHLERSDLTIRRFVGGAYSVSQTIAGGAMAVTREAFERAGGWADVQRHVDKALIRDVVASGGSVFRTHGLGYVLVRHDDHTWQSDEARFLDQAEERWSGLPDWILGDHPADGCRHPVNR